MGVVYGLRLCFKYYNMFDNSLIAELKKVVGWKNHYDLTEIPALSATLNETLSGQVYQDFHPLVRLDYIKALLPSNYHLETYLDDVQTEAINEVLNRLVTEKKLKHKGEDIAQNNLILHNVVRGEQILNESRFVGVRFALNDHIGIRAVINRIGLYFTQPQTDLTLYLYNSLQAGAVATYAYNSAAANSFQWLEQTINLDVDDGTGTSGGVWYLGYYQDDVTGNAIKYKTLNWRYGYCNSCGNVSGFNKKYKSVNKYVDMTPFYVASASLPAVGQVFLEEDVVETVNNNHGFNFNISIKCNLTQFWKDNKLTMANAIGKMVSFKVLQMISTSSQVSAVEQNVQIMALRALEADNETKATTFLSQVERAIKTTNLDQGNVNNSPCLPCARHGNSIGIL